MTHRSNIGENLTREAIAAGAEDDLRTLVDQLYSVRNAAPDWFNHLRLNAARFWSTDGVLVDGVQQRAVIF